jgi:TonB family protein
MQPTVILLRICCAVLLLGSMNAHAAKTTQNGASGGAGAGAQCRPAWPAKTQGNSKGYPNPAASKLALSLDPNGRFVDAKIVWSSGYVDLDAALLAALARCNFESVPKGGATPQKWLTVEYGWPYSEKQQPGPIKLPAAR